MHFLALDLETLELRDSHTSEGSVQFMGILMLPAAMWTVGALMHLG